MVDSCTDRCRAAASSDRAAPKDKRLDPLMPPPCATKAIGSASCRSGSRQQGLLGTCCMGSDTWHTATDLVTKANALVEDFADLLRHFGGKSRLQLGYQRLPLLHDGWRPWNRSGMTHTANVLYSIPARETSSRSTSA